MSTIQIVGIAAATVVVLLLIIALVVTRKSGEEETRNVAESGGGASFLDSSPSDTFAKLGRPEEVSPPPLPVEPPEAMAADPAVVMTVTGVASSADGGLGLDWDKPEPSRPKNAPSAVAPPTPPAEESGPPADESGLPADESEATGELPVITTDATMRAPEDEPSAEATGELPVVAPVVSEPVAAEAEPASPAASAAEVVASPQAAPKSETEDGPGWVAQAVAEGETTSETGGGPEASDDRVPLSSIIVTTSTKMVDLRDPDVRRMLTELVTFEIDQATQFRKNGQPIDAVLQLTEAEKICRALGKHDTAREIRDMMRELKD